MKLIIAGGRDYKFTQVDFDYLNSLEDVSEVVSGGAPGADSEGEEWAQARGIPVTVFLAD